MCFMLIGMKRTQTKHTVTPRTVTVALAKDLHPAIGRNRMYRAIQSGALRGARVGKRFAIPVDELDAWVMAGAPESSSD